MPENERSHLEFVAKAFKNGGQRVALSEYPLGEECQSTRYTMRVQFKHLEAAVSTRPLLIGPSNARLEPRGSVTSWHGWQPHRLQAELDRSFSDNAQAEDF